VRPFRWTAATGLSLFSSVAPENADCDRCVVVSSDGGDVLAAEGGSRGDGLFLWSAGRGRRHLDELPGDWQASYGAAISDDGLVVAGTSRSGEGDRAFRWTERDGMTPVGPPGSRGVEVSLSDDGATLLGVLPWDRTSLAARAAFFHRAGASDIESLGPGVAGATGCYPTKLSGDGTTVVGDCVGGVQAPAFSWTAASGLVPIQVPTDHFDWLCSASAVSRSGAVVGITCERPIGAVTTESRALLSTGLSAPLRDLRPALAGDLLRIVDLSADGLVALGEDRSNGMRRGFRWALDTGSVLIPSVSGSRELPGASTQSGMDTSFSVVTSGGRGATPLDLTPDGTQSLFHTAGALGRLTPASDLLQALPSPVLGSAGPVRGGLLSADGNTAIAMYERRGPSRGTHLVHATRIWIWDAANGGRWLDAALAAAGVDVSGWTLERIVDISADGKHLLGNGIDPAGRVEAWLVVLP
jgi:probable HAF family extracellular repeat protein